MEKTSHVEVVSALDKEKQALERLSHVLTQQKQDLALLQQDMHELVQDEKDRAPTANLDQKEQREYAALQRELDEITALLCSAPPLRVPRVGRQMV